MSYQNRIVLNKKTKPEEIFASIPIISHHMGYFWPIQDTRCTGLVSGSDGVAVLTQDKNTRFPATVHGLTAS